MAKARAGRKRKAMAKRHPNGAINRGLARQQQGREEAIKTRQRVYGLTYRQAASERAGSALGRAYFRGQITDGMYLAGVEYARRWVRWAMVTDAPMPHVRAMDYAREVRGDQSGYLSAYFVAKAKRQMAESDAALAFAGKGPAQMVRAVTVDDVEANAWDGDRIVQLCNGLRALVDTYGLPDAGFIDSREIAGVLLK